MIFVYILNARINKLLNYVITTTTTDAHLETLNFKSIFVTPPLKRQLLSTSTSLNISNNTFSISPLFPACSSLWHFSYVDRVRERWSGVSKQGRESYDTLKYFGTHGQQQKRHKTATPRQHTTHIKTHKDSNTQTTHNTQESYKNSNT